MDFWNRLIGGTGPATPKKHAHPVPQTPQDRLNNFQRAWRTTLHTWRNAREHDPTSNESLRLHIKRLTDMLIEEERRSERICMNFAYEHKLFIAVSKIAQGGDAGVVQEATTFFSTLIDNEDEFLSNASFSEALIDFLKSVKQKGISGELESDFVELLFSIAAKIRLMPGILPVWFSSRSRDESEFANLKPEEQFAGITNKEDFPLFYLLIDYVYYEGRVGEFARTGLLYIIGSAQHSSELERWIVESDLATLMASGLGALYSQLSRKLVVSYGSAEAPAVLRLSDYKPAPVPLNPAEFSSSPEFQINLETFLSYLIFWQDVLEHCKSMEVKQTLLDHFQVLFLQQLLYPSLLESSDVDGGSSVAVLTYVRLILDTLEHAEINHLILSYLLALPERPKSSSTSSSPSVARARRRKSLDLLTQMTAAADVDHKPTPALFNLVDLILTSLKSRSQQTVSATLRLISTIVRKHHPYAVSTLLRVTPVQNTRRTIGAHNKEMELLFSIINQLGDSDVSVSYEQHLKDNQILLENHPCTAKCLALRGGPVPASKSISTLGKDVTAHTLRTDDPLLKSIVGLLSTFFTNSVETNLVLTCVIIDLACCAYMRPEGWLLFDPESYAFPEEIEEPDELSDDLDLLLSEDKSTSYLARLEKEKANSIRLAQREPNFTSTPPVLEVLQGLASQIQVYRREIPDLDSLLQERRNAFNFSEQIDDAINTTTRRRNTILEVLSQKSNHHGPAPPPSRGRTRGSGERLGLSRLLGGSPSPEPEGRKRTLSSPVSNHIMDTTLRKIRAIPLPVPTPLDTTQPLHRPPPPEPLDGQSGTATPAGSVQNERIEGSEEGKAEISVSHLLTNVLVLQEFVLELAALVQVRAGLVGDLVFG